MRCLALAIVLLAVTVGRLAAETFAFGGYELWLSCAQKGDRVFLEGRISNGEQCRTLRVDALVENSDGNRKKIQAWVQDAGGFGSRLVEGDVKVKGNGTGPWRIHDVEAKCLSRK